MKEGSAPAYHKAGSVEQLTEQNVATIVELERSAQAQRTAADRIADFITRICGSMPFIIVHVLWFGGWISWNTLRVPFDPFPFPFLTLVVSLEAILLSTFLLISANRQGRLDARRNQLDLQIDLLSEQENTKMLSLLNEIALKLGVDPHKDPSVAVLEQATRPEKLVEQIDRSAQQIEREVRSE